MTHIFFAGLLLIIVGCSSVQTVSAKVNVDASSKTLAFSLHQKKWIHGSPDCKSNTDPSLEVFRYDQTSYILRQNKCLSFEAPFIYVLFGDEKVLVLDTGATESALDFPLYETVQLLIKEQSEESGKTDRELLVIHSHSHRDHYKGDSQFRGKPKVTLIEPNKVAVAKFFNDMSQHTAELNVELGKRQLIILSTPGHQEEAITIYDSQTKWMLTGDTLYPGYIYVKNWRDYKNSIAAMVLFSKTHEISAVLGSHIEMTSQAGEYYPIGTTYQPNEAALTLTLENLTALHSELQKLERPKKVIFNNFIVAPMSFFQKALSNLVRWTTQ